MRWFLRSTQALAAALVLWLVAWPAAAAQGGAGAAASPPAGQPIVVRLAPGATRQGLQAAVGSQGARLEAPSALDRLGVAVVLAPAAQLTATLASLRSLPGVISAEPARPVYAAETIPNDPEWPRQYGMQHVQAPRAWDVTAGQADVIVAVIDSGVDLGHADLSPKLWHNAAETPNGQDDDGNGYVDDLAGWDFVNGDGQPADDYGHGTHVAGIAAALGNNGIGVAGLAWNARLMALKVLNAGGAGYDFHVAEAILYAADNGARVINVSLGGPSLGDYVREAVDYAYTHGALVVAAAGNENRWGLLYPAAYPNAVGVTATDESGQRAGFSNYGDAAEIAAPGSSILSTALGGGYTTMWGTSMSTPHVAGAAALLASTGTFDTLAQIREALRRSAKDLGDPGWDPYYGYGLLQVYNALSLLPACEGLEEGVCFRVFIPLFHK